MKNFTFLLIGLVALTFTTNAQKTIAKKTKKATKASYVYKQPNNCSPYTAMLIADIKNKGRTDKLVEKYNLTERENKFFVSAFIKVSDELNKSELYDLNIKLNTQAGNIYTAIIPVENLEKLFLIEGVEYVEIGHKAEFQLDEARSATWVDLVHDGYNLSQSYTGDGVIVGDIDCGFDYTHPTFYNADYTQYRISRVWEQNETGTPPPVYSYGNELVGESTITSDGYDITNSSHGTHVTGIAAGSGSILSDAYKGVAYESEIVLVSLHSPPADTYIADGISYIFDCADFAGKPAVINISLGNHFGPHDGTSFFDQYCDAMVGEGRILVGAAGNDGFFKLHLNYDFGSNEETVYSFIEFLGSSNNTNGSTFIAIWGEAYTDFTIAVNICNIDNQVYEDYTPYISTSTDNTYNYTLIDSDPTDSDECIVSITVEHSNPFNNKPNVKIYFDNTDQDEPGDIYDYVEIEIKGSNTSFDAWCCSEGPIFTNKGFASPRLDGNTNTTIAEIGGTGNSIITVGAYTSKNNYYDFQGINHNIPYYVENGEIAPFSGLGPTVDGRIKPDITAPGNVIVSSVNSFDAQYTSTSTEVVDGVNDGTTTWWFATMQGTSMACPMVTGIVALWLEANPNLTPDEIKQFMQNNAWTDSYTGSVPNYTWGYGKINAHETIKAIENTVGVATFNKNNKLSIFSNPSNGQIILNINDETMANIQIFDLLGKIVYSKQIKNIKNKTVVKIDISNNSQGIYFVKVYNDNIVKVKKIILY